MFKRFFSVLFLTSFAAAGFTATEPLMERAERAQLSAAVGELRECHAELTKRLEEGSEATADRYNLAYVSWRINQTLYASDGDAEEREQLLEDARGHLETVVEAEPENVEAMALLAGVLGESIGESMMRGMTLGPKAGSLLNKAARLAPENPRVALERGVSYLHTPGMFGGGLDKAIGELERARALFALQETAEPWPSWGRVDAYAWLGQALAKKGRVDDARRVYQEALEIEPNAGWIRFSLLPALDR